MAMHASRLETTPGDGQSRLRQLELDLSRVDKPTKLGPRLALSPDEAAAVLGVSRDYFDEHVLPELRIVRRGRRILIAVTELERWLDRSAARASAMT